VPGLIGGSSCSDFWCSPRIFVAGQRTQKSNGDSSVVHVDQHDIRLVGRLHGGRQAKRQHKSQRQCEYASLCNDTSASLVNERLFLPEEWTEDPDRCTTAGIPPEARRHQTKPQQALSMIDELDNWGIHWWYIWDKA
jgi:hypothetical protein